MTVHVEERSSGGDNGLVPSWSSIKVDPGELVWEEDNFEKLGREDWFLYNFTPARLSLRIVSTFPYDI